MYHALSKCPTELHSICDELLSLIGALFLVNTTVKDGQCSSLTDMMELESLEKSSETLMSELETAMAKCKAHEADFREVLLMQGKIMTETSLVTSFFGVLRR